MLVILFEKKFIFTSTIMSTNQQYMKKMQAGLHWLRTYCKLSEERCHAILNAANDQVRFNSYIGDEEYFIYWVKVLGLSEAGVKKPELILRNPLSKKRERDWRIKWY